MARTKISEFSATPGNNTDIDGINISEGCAPSGINDAIRELMSQLKDFQAGTSGDSFNGPVGTTTAAAGAFTTLSASSSVTLSGGTANGVAYLNGSKVLTTGSALTFNGFQLTVNTATNVGNLTVGANGSNQNALGFIDTNTSGRQWVMGPGVGTGTGGAFGMYDVTGASLMSLYSAGSSGFWSWYQNGSEQMRLTSTGLGIGTSSPANKLQVNPGATGGGYAGINASGADVNLEYQRWSGSGSNFGGFRITGSTTSGNGNLIFSSGNETTIGAQTWTEWMRLQGGNLGLGVTPSAWAYGGNLQIKGGSAVSFASQYGGIYANAYDNGGFKYISNAPANSIGFNNGQIEFKVAPSGTAGNAISFTQAMTLDASGNWLLGSTSSPGTIWSGDRTFAYVKGSAANRSGEVIVESNNGNQQASFFASGGSAEFGLWSTKASAILFGNNNAERARIDSLGRMAVGTTASDAQFVIGGSGAGGWVSGSRNTLWMRNSNASGNQSNFIALGSAASSTYCFIGNDINADGTTVNQLNIQAGASGGVYLANGGTSWTSVSDERLKDIIEPIAGAIDKVSTIRAVIGKYKTDDTDKRRSFLIAQDVQAVLPEAVTVGSDEMNTLGVSYTDTIPLLTAAIQEQQAIIEQLKADVAALKGN